jgi:hypothetical protein
LHNICLPSPEIWACQSTTGKNGFASLENNIKNPAAAETGLPDLLLKKKHIMPKIERKTTNFLNYDYQYANTS